MEAKMTLRQSLGCLLLCVAVVAASAEEKEILIQANGNKCQANDVTISHDYPNKNESVHWKSADNGYHLVFKNNVSPCHADQQAGPQLSTFAVPPARASLVSDTCYARKKTNEGSYPYTIYTYSTGKKKWVKCADPRVVVSDGQSTSSVPPKKK